MPVKENISKPEKPVVMVTFRLGSQTYALPIAPVRQIIEMVKITPLPQVNQAIVGVINFHGLLVPVINMRHIFGLEVIPFTLHTPIILMNISNRLVGLTVDRVLDVVERPADQVVDPNNILLEEMGETPLLQGLIQTQGESILVLSPEHLLTSYNARVLSEAINTLTQSIEQKGGGDVDSEDHQNLSETTVAEIEPSVQTVVLEEQKEPEVQPSKPPKKRRHKKTSAPAKRPKEVSA